MSSKIVVLSNVIIQLIHRKECIFLSSYHYNKETNSIGDCQIKNDVVTKNTSKLLNFDGFYIDSLITLQIAAISSETGHLIVLKGISQEENSFNQILWNIQTFAVGFSRLESLRDIYIGISNFTLQIINLSMESPTKFKQDNIAFDESSVVHIKSLTSYFLVISCASSSKGDKVIFVGAFDWSSLQLLCCSQIPISDVKSSVNDICIINSLNQNRKPVSLRCLTTESLKVSLTVLLTTADKELVCCDYNGVRWRFELSEEGQTFSKFQLGRDVFIICKESKAIVIFDADNKMIIRTVSFEGELTTYWEPFSNNSVLFDVNILSQRIESVKISENQIQSSSYKKFQSCLEKKVKHAAPPSNPIKIISDQQAHLRRQLHFKRILLERACHSWNCATCYHDPTALPTSALLYSHPPPGTATRLPRAMTPLTPSTGCLTDYHSRPAPQLTLLPDDGIMIVSVELLPREKTEDNTLVARRLRVSHRGLDTVYWRSILAKRTDNICFAWTTLPSFATSSVEHLDVFLITEDTEHSAKHKSIYCGHIKLTAAQVAFAPPLECSDLPSAILDSFLCSDQCQLTSTSRPVSLLVSELANHVDLLIANVDGWMRVKRGPLKSCLIKVEQESQYSAKLNIRSLSQRSTLLLCQAIKSLDPLNISLEPITDDLNSSPANQNAFSLIDKVTNSLTHEVKTLRLALSSLLHFGEDSFVIPFDSKAPSEEDALGFITRIKSKLDALNGQAISDEQLTEALSTWKLAAEQSDDDFNRLALSI